jgi:putative ABC transport system ATP-binding protein
MSVLIQVKNLNKQYDNDGVTTPVLHDINFEINEGEFVAIMGPSGSGKSTLMHLLGFLDQPSGGEYFFKGTNSAKLSDDEMAAFRNNEIGFVFQSFNLLPRTTVLENVSLPLIYSTVPPAKQKAQSLKAIGAVGLAHRASYLSNQLSGGEKQRVAIARALVNDPAIIFADEPTGNLDSKTGGQIMAILQKLNDEGKTIILVTHEQTTAEHAKRIIKVRDGEIVADNLVAKRILIHAGEELKK